VTAMRCRWTLRVRASVRRGSGAACHFVALFPWRGLSVTCTAGVHVALCRRCRRWFRCAAQDHQGVRGEARGDGHAVLTLSSAVVGDRCAGPPRAAGRRGRRERVRQGSDDDAPRPAQVLDEALGRRWQLHNPHDREEGAAGRDVDASQGRRHEATEESAQHGAATVL
jgi:hypothetical protein